MGRRPDAGPEGRRKKTGKVVIRTLHKPARLRGSVVLLGDKSVSHRALMLNSISHGTATVRGLSLGDDVASTIGCLRAMGVAIEYMDGPDVVRVAGSAGELQEPEDVLDAGNSGTTMRLLSGILAGQAFTSVLSGDRSLRSRPMGRIVEPLSCMGARIMGRKGGAYAPLTLSGGGLKGIEYTLPVASAQVKSSIMLAGIHAEGKTLVHQPALSRDHTELMMRAMGASVVEDGTTICLEPAKLAALDVVVPGDISSAAFWMVAAACHPDAEVTITNAGINPTRGGILEVMEGMGADVRLLNRRVEGGEPVADILVRSGDLVGTEIGGDVIPRVIDELPVIAVAACFAKGKTTIRDAGELRVKESDRITTMVAQLSRMGAHVEELPDGMVIDGTGHLTGAECTSHGDHRIAMAMGIAGLLADGTTVVGDAEAASISYPTFWDEIDAILAGSGA